MRGSSLVTIGLIGLLLAGGAQAMSTVFIVFQTPSTNIFCGFTDQPDYLRCDIGSGIKPAPARPKGCELDFGNDVGMRATGRASLLCYGDTVRARSARVVQYGATWRHAGITCVSATTGLRCTNTSGHGFFLSREHTYVF